MSRVVVQQSFGAPEVLEIREIEAPWPAAGQVRVRVAAAGLNPVDWIIAGSEDVARNYGISLPAGFGNDFAGTVDEVGEGVNDFAVGDRVFGGARGHAVGDHVIMTLDRERLRHTPDGVDDVTASVLPIAGNTADAALTAIGIGPGDTVLIGGAAGGVGIFAIQLARIAGARVIATASESSFDHLRALGAEPVVYGDGLVARVRELAPAGITAATDLHGTEVAYAALELGVPIDRISTIAAHDPKLHAKAVGGKDAAPDALDRIAALVADGQISVPIAASYPLERIRDAVALQATRHVRGKVTLVL